MDAEAYNARGLSHRAAGDEDAAYADFTECIRLMTTNPAPYYNRGLVEMERGHWPEALADFDRALLLNPREPDALTHRASTRSRLGDFAGALDDCNHLVKLYPNDSLAYLNRAIIRFNHADLAAALGDCISALARDPRDTSALNLRGKIQGSMGLVSEAVEDYDRAIAIRSNESETYRNRAFARGRQGDISGALRDFREAMRLDGSNAGDNPDFQPGQCWEYEAPEGEEASRVHVLMTEQMGRVPVVHVAISHLAHSGTLEHLPMSLTALRSSVVRLDMACPIPDGLDLSGIAMWRKAVTEGGGGVWSNPLKEVVTMLTAINTAGYDGGANKETVKTAPRWKFWKRWRSGQI